MWIYSQPFIECTDPRSSPYCHAKMVLPFPWLREWWVYALDDDPAQEAMGQHLANWPEEDWSANIGCPVCGTILRYASPHVSFEPVYQKVRGRYYSDTTCYRVELECAKDDCRTPAHFHTVLGGEIVSESALLNRLAGGFFGGECSKGHSLLPIEKERYKLTRALDPIPSEG